MRNLTRTVPLLLGLSALLFAVNAGAHSASDSYLTLEIDKATSSHDRHTTSIQGQWDIALRDLDFVLKLDDDGDGNISWGELQKHQAAITRYAFAHLSATTAGASCQIRPRKQMVTNHADGAYAALFFDIDCASAPRNLALDYRLFFSVDPSHRAIVVIRSGQDTATSLLSPEKARIDLKL